MDTKKRILVGEVISNKMDKTVVVRVVRKKRHPQYEKRVESWKKYYAHDEKNQTEVGQKVRIIEMRPMSKLKRWLVLEN